MELLWSARSEDDLPPTSGWLSDAEDRRLGSMRFTKRRTEFLVSRWTAKHTIARVHGSFPADGDGLGRIEIRHHPDGAPAAFIDGVAWSRRISMTDRAGWAVCLVSPGSFEVGCDLEVVEPRSEAFVADYLTPPEQTLVGDGEKVWLYDPELEQVTVRKVADALGGTPAALLAGDGSAEAAFSFTDGGTRDGLQWVEATPKDSESSFARVRFGFAGKLLSRMELQDHFGQLTVIAFSKLRINAPLPAGQFRFTVPAGVDVIGG